MSDIKIKQIETKRELKKFIKFPFKLYEGNEFWVPPLIREELDTFNPKKNPAFENAEAKLFLAYKSDTIVGRIAGILSHSANKKYQTKNLRFNWFDSINDFEVAKALFDAIEDWGRELGMITLTGPHGFTDLDPEGMLVEGFDQLPTIAVIYNYQYYNELLEKYGFIKDVDYVEFRSVVPLQTGVPERLLTLAERVKQRSKIRVLKFESKKQAKKRGEELFHLLDEAFEEIYGSVPLTEKQIQYYIKKYLPFVSKDLLKAVVNEQDEMIGFMIPRPSCSKASHKATGKLFPFGFIHILKALKE
ncbi:MAG: hypothetical protein N3A61_02165, partial [Ignavibacteria bacterium]|nr:hypothetical protein [Ignavibacteria bacterium]